MEKLIANVIEFMEQNKSQTLAGYISPRCVALAPSLALLAGFAAPAQDPTQIIGFARVRGQLIFFCYQLHVVRITLLYSFDRCLVRQHNP